MIGYMVTWTTYGTWLQGDQHGYVKNGIILPPNEGIRNANRNLQKFEEVRFSKTQRKIVENAILEEAQNIGQKICAIAVCSNHVHIVAEPCRQTIEEIVSRYKNKAMFELRKTNHVGRIWTRGFDKRFCFSAEDLAARIDYVNKHHHA
jgi:REP element-mobilizing transposase RayT